MRDARVPWIALKFDGGRILADNVDDIGLFNDSPRNLGLAQASKRMLPVGAGGAARGARPGKRAGLYHMKVLPISPEPTTADSGYALVDNN